MIKKIKFSRFFFDLQAEPADSYIVKNQPVSLTCTATPSHRIFFKCNDEWVRPESHITQEKLDPATRHVVVTSAIEITRLQVRNAKGGPAANDASSRNKGL